MAQIKSIEFNSDLDGYVIAFTDGKVAHTQFKREENKLDGGYGEVYLSRYAEYDTVSDEQGELVDEFVDEFNKLTNSFEYTKEEIEKNKEKLINEWLL